jgi:hypothetical protein
VEGILTRDINYYHCCHSLGALIFVFMVLVVFGRLLKKIYKANIKLIQNGIEVYYISN